MSNDNVDVETTPEQLPGSLENATITPKDKLIAEAEKGIRAGKWFSMHVDPVPTLQGNVRYAMAFGVGGVHFIETSVAAALHHLETMFDAIRDVVPGHITDDDFERVRQHHISAFELTIAEIKRRLAVERDEDA